MTKATIIVKGRVQGVGYRYFVRGKAKKFNVKGLVRNLENGAVEVFADGNEEQIKAFIDNIKDNGVESNVVVDELSVYTKGSQNYKGPWRTYGNNFIIDKSARREDEYIHED
jgi:acylphosphatase